MDEGEADRHAIADCINEVVLLLARIFENDYPFSQTVRMGLMRVLDDRYRGSLGLFKDNFVHPTIKLLQTLKERNFPLSVRETGHIVVHLVPPPTTQFQVGEFFFQVGHTQPGSLAAKFVKYDNGNKVVLQNSTIGEDEYDIAFTHEFLDSLRREATKLGDVLMRTLVVCKHDGTIDKEEVQLYLQRCPVERRARFRSDSHLSVEESGDDGWSYTSGVSQHSEPSENLEDDEMLK